MENARETARIERRIRLLLWGFIVGLVLSGVTAFPLPQEARLLTEILPPGPLLDWIVRVRGGLEVAETRYPFLLYGTDWLAFAHLVIALAFLGPLNDPIRNVWVVHWATVACVGVVPLALIAGAIRDIPFWWRLVDCSFGVIGIVPLWICLRMIRRLNELRAERWQAHIRNVMREKFERSDGWLLVSIQALPEPFDLEKLRSTSNLLNYEVGNDREISEGMHRLERAGYAWRDGKRFSVTPEGERFLAIHGGTWRTGHIQRGFLICDALVAVTAPRAAKVPARERVAKAPHGGPGGRSQ